MNELESVINEVKAQHLAARKDKDRAALEALGPLLGDAETKMKGTQAFGLPEFYGLVRSHIGGLSECVEKRGTPISPNEAAQLAVLNRFLPKMMTNTEMVEEASRYIRVEGIEKGGMGRVMAHFKATYPGQYDGKALAGIVKDLI